MFPSPYGEDKGFILVLQLLTIGLLQRFRPLTGKIKVLFQKGDFYELVCGRFRPLTGNIKILFAVILLKKGSDEFPSPYGEYKDFMFQTSFVMLLTVDGFRPLTGNIKIL